MTYARAVTAQLLDFDAATVITGALDEAFDIFFMDELNGFGTGSCSLALSDPDADELQRGRFVQILIAGTPRFAFKIESSPQYRQIDTDEERGQILTVSGRGWGCVWEEAIIYPEGPLDLPLDYSYRLWSFASINFPNAAAWNPAIEDYEYFDGVTESTRVQEVEDPGADPDDPGDDELKLYPAPIGFPWPNAPKNGNGSAPTPVYDPTYWVRADGSSVEDIGYHFFIGSFELAGEQECKFTVTADNLFTLYLDGVPILGEDADLLMWMGWKEVTLNLPAGDHVVAAAVHNVEADVDYNPGGLLLAVIAMAIYPGDIATTETLSLLTSGATDLVRTFFVSEGGDWPGWSPGQIMESFWTEAQARGALTQFVGDTFAATTDSDGNTWDSVDPITTITYIPTFAMRVGENGGDMLRQLHAEGWIDWHFQADDLTLDAYAQGQAGTVQSVTLAAGTNIIGLERGETRPYANALLIQGDFAAGFAEVEDSIEIADYGSRVEDILTTDARTMDEAQRIGRVELARRVVGAQAAVVVVMEPTSTADCPYEAFTIGDYIDIPQVDGTGTDTVQVLSIQVRTDDEGFATWTLECNARLRTPQHDVLHLLRSIGGKTLGTVTNHGVAKD